MVIQFPSHSDDRGNLYVCEAQSHVPFDIQRVFWVTNPVASRGGHYHERCWQCVVLLNGSMKVTLDDAEFRLTSPRFGVLIEPGTLITLSDFSAGCAYMVMCSEHYDAEEIIQVKDGQRKGIAGTA